MCGREIKIIYENFGYPENRSVSESFESLTKIIIGQQISTNVAKRIYDNLKDKNILNETVLYKMSLEELMTDIDSSRLFKRLASCLAHIGKRDFFGAYKSCVRKATYFKRPETYFMQ